MKSQSVMLLVVAAVCGLFAMFGVKQAMNAKAEPAEETITVLQAAMDVQIGDLLDETNTQMVQVNVSACPEGVVRSFDEIKERSTRVPMLPGDWILTSKLSEQGETGAATNIPEGMRVSTIPVDATQTHSGMLRPGNRVDIVLTYLSKDEGNSRRQISRTILQYIEVFAVDNRIYGIDKTGEAANGAKNVSVLVTPEQGNLLQLAKSMGQLSTSLRANSDTAEVAVTEVTDDVLGRVGGTSNVGAGSMMEFRDRFSSGDTILFEDTPPLPVEDQLMAEWQRGEFSEPTGSMPVIQLADASPANTWTIEIREGSTVRLEAVKLPEAHGTTEGFAGRAQTAGAGSFWDFLKTPSTP